MKEKNSSELWFIEIDGYFSAEGIDSVKELVAKRFENSEKDKYYYDFMNWKKNENQILVGTFRAPDQLPLNQLLDCTFNKDNFDEFSFQEYKIIHSLQNGWIPANSVAQGRNHLLVIEYSENIPSIIFKLHKENQYRPTAPTNGYRLGLCRKKDFKTISEKLKISQTTKK